MSGARKDDLGKPRLSLIPPAPLFEIAQVLTLGADQYGDWNWASQGGMNWSRLMDAKERHYNYFKAGVDRDHKTGLLHLAHDVTNGIFLIQYQLAQIGTDDRNKDYASLMPIFIDKQRQVK